MLFRKSANAPAPRIGAPKETTSLALCVAIALAWSVVLALLSFTARWQDHVEARGFDELTFVTAPSASKFPITVVGIDEASFHQLGLQWPWPRSVHAELIDRLSKAGAAVIVLDVVFSEPSTPKEDQRFAEAIKRAGNVVLAADRYYDETGGVRQWLRLDPAQIFLDAGAQTGLASVTLDRDTALRSMPDSQDAMWRAIIRRLMIQHAEISPNLAIKPGSLIHYAGPDHTFPYVSYHEVVKPTGSIPADFFKDQIVIVGRDIRAAADVGSAQADMFRTPFTARDSKLMPGAEVHANILETVLGGQAVAPVPPAAVVALLTLVALGCGLLMRRWRPLVSAMIGVAVLAAVLALDWWLFASLQIWLPAASTLAAAPAMYVSLGGVSFLREQARKREVTQAFSLYVTPQVVDSLLANPDKLKLGGERREITFMFTDLAGFTTFSEQLSAERTVYLLNRHFTDMTDIVLKHGGTVSRFIGDAIMAFWGAPLDDDKQALNAVRAAIEMQEGMQKLREEFVKEGLPAIQMRVGIQSGSAIAGNLGSARRFDYTVIGDDVNLAARLEGINKLYGTGIMIGDATARQVAGEIPLRPVDRVIVKGKSQPVETFTPCDDAEWIRLSTEGIQFFRAKAWDESEARWRAILESHPGDKVAKLYLERIADFRKDPPPGGWDGAVSLEKL